MGRGAKPRLDFTKPPHAFSIFAPDWAIPAVESFNRKGREGLAKCAKQIHQISILPQSTDQMEIGLALDTPGHASFIVS
jgi:hypothetical protein